MSLNPGIDEMSPFIRKWLRPQSGSFEMRTRTFWHSLIEIFDCKQVEAKKIWDGIQICSSPEGAMVLVSSHLHFLVWQMDRGKSLSAHFRGAGKFSPLHEARLYNSELSRVWRASTIVLCNFTEFFLFDLNDKDSVRGHPLARFSLEDLFDYRMYFFLLFSGKIFSQRYRNLDGVQVERAPWPISPSLPEMRRGNTALSGGNFYLGGEKEKEEAMKDCVARKYIREFVRAVDLRGGRIQYCLWLLNSSRKERRKSSFIRKKLIRVKAYRKKLGSFGHDFKPWKFAEIRQPDCSYLAIPTRFSIDREYVPCGFFSKDVIVSDTLDVCPDPQGFAFAVASSAMFKSWQEVAAEIDESRIVHFSIHQVWNTFPLPPVSEEDKILMEECAKKVLLSRERHKDIPLSELYLPEVLPEDLRKAHADLDKIVDSIFGEKCRDNEERKKVVTIVYKETPFGSNATFLKRASTFVGQISLRSK